MTTIWQVYKHVSAGKAWLVWGTYSDRGRAERVLEQLVEAGEIARLDSLTWDTITWERRTVIGFN